MGVNNTGMKDQADYNIRRMGKAMRDLFNWTIVFAMTILLVLPVIGVVVKAFQLLNCIKDAAATSSDNHKQSLQRFYTYYLWYWILTIIFFIGTFLWIFSLLSSVNINEVTSFDQIFEIVNTVSIAINLSVLIPTFLSIIAFVAFEDFAKKNARGNLNGNELVTGAKYLKYSAIANLFSVIPVLGLLLTPMGFILQLAGLYKSGQGLQGGVSFGSSFTPEPQYTMQDKTEKNQGTKICSNYGNENIPNSRFCRSCGSLLD
jgi:hypothetical protein